MTRPTYFLVFAGLILLGTQSHAQLEIKSERDVKDASSLLLPTKTLKDGAKSAGGAPRKPTKGPTEITAKSMNFDQKSNIVVFSEDVVAKDPQFDITCQKLTAYMKKTPSKGTPAGANSSDPAPLGVLPAEPIPDNSPKKKSESAMEKVIAEGDVIIVQDKVDAEGKPKHYVAKGQKAVYETSTGDVTLYGWPEITESIGGSMSKKTIAREESCIIILNSERGISVKDGYSTTSFQDMSGMTDGKPKTPQ